MNIRDAVRAVAGGTEVNVMVSPNSDRQGTEGVNEWRRCLVIRVRSPPLEGKANREVEEYLKNVTGCRSEVIRGHTNRQKTVMIHGDSEKITEALEKEA